MNIAGSGLIASRAQVERLKDIRDGPGAGGPVDDGSHASDYFNLPLGRDFLGKILIGF